VAGLLYTVASPTAAFIHVAACMAFALAGLAWAAKPGWPPDEPAQVDYMKKRVAAEKLGGLVRHTDLVAD